MSEQDQKNQQQAERQFLLQRIYVKDVSFETPNSPDVFRQEWKPENNLNLNTQVNKLEDEAFEVVLTLTLTVKVGEKTAYLAEVQQAGIFSFKGFQEQELPPMFGVLCPNTLFPYAREAISDLVAKGSFPQMALQPINFEALFMQQQQQMAQQAAQQGAH
jgi:preprotein translocase subunit SecB